LVNTNSIWHAAIILFMFLTGCTVVNTEGQIKNVHYKLIKDGSYNSAEVSIDAVRCPIVESELYIQNGKYIIDARCKTLLK
jgi:hypothetical protein